MSRLATILRLARWCVFSCLPARTISRNGLRYEVRYNDALDRHLLNAGEGGDYSKVIKMIARLQENRITAIDVGANAGYWTLPLGKEFDYVIAVEPDPFVFRKLERNIALNPLIMSRITLIQAAAGDSAGFVPLTIRRSIDGDALLNRGLSSTVTFGRKVMSVPMVQIDQMKITELQKVSLIKIDVEGSEFGVLSGATAIITRDKPLVFWEAALSIDRKFCHRNVERCLNLLNSLGYSHYYFTTDDKPINFCEVSDLDTRGIDCDIISVLKGSEVDLKVMQLILEP